MKISKVSFSLVLYLALIEGISLFVLDYSRNDFFSAFLVGFIPAIVVLMLYRFVSSILPIKLNNKPVSNVPIVFLSIANGLFIILLFLIQELMIKIEKFSSLFGLLSVFLTFLILILIYNKLNFKVKFDFSGASIKVKKISLYFAVYAGILEALILPLMNIFYSINMPSLLNGFIAGLIGGSIGLVVVNYILSKYPLELL